MSWYSLAILILGVGLEVALLARGFATGAPRRHPIFYSYIAYVLCGEFLGIFIYYFYPQDYPSVFWFCFVIRTLAEFGVLLGVSDGVFRPYPPVRILGRVIVVLACAAFVLLFWLPMRENAQPTPVLFLNLIRLSAITKAVAIAWILASAHSYRIPLGRNAAGILLGFAAYQTIGVANFAARIHFGTSIYSGIFIWLGPLSFGICLTIWTFTLWNVDPVLNRKPLPENAMGVGSARPEVELRRFSTYVSRLLWK